MSPTCIPLFSIKEVLHFLTFNSTLFTPISLFRISSFSYSCITSSFFPSHYPIKVELFILNVVVENPKLIFLSSWFHIRFRAENDFEFHNHLR
ncbi:hypothetical protein Lalb_Chr07g0193141 [Lupinus albus]|uniref:Uncharacterized protein n=1 Tax=Lupinus albus TaxID=3870 RepID=A0A6A4QBY6_LUPAL|nr:hypothetical protein Lalb_Chr07g0193141 [Lupinus albus]